MFLKLQDLDHFLNDKTVQFKEEVVGGVEVVTPCYMIASDKLWHTEHGRELRGHTFRKDTGQLISLALQKFFNVDETEETQSHNLNWDNIESVTEKVDGSMITFALIDGEVYCKTKKTFYSDVAIEAQNNLPDNVKDMVTYLMTEMALSPIMEFTHPDWKVVINYGKEPTWTLLAIRSMLTGEYLLAIDVWKFAHMFGLRSPNIEKYNTLAQINTAIDGMTNEEGYVITFKDGSKVKKKCLWYLLRHHINTDLRERDVINMIDDESIDDVKSAIVEAGYELDLVLALENRYVSEFTGIVTKTEALCELMKTMPDKKTMALALSNNPLFGLAVRVFDGRDPDYKKQWRKTFYNAYSLKTLYSDFNHSSEIVVDTE